MKLRSFAHVFLGFFLLSGCTSSPMKPYRDPKCEIEISRSIPRGTVAKKLTIGKADGLTKDQIESVIVRRKDDFANCERDFFQEGEKEGGTILVHGMINLDGSVGKTCASEATFDIAAFRGCLLGVFDQMKFPSPAGNIPITFSYPLSFTYD